ncbi:MAG: hypothetical protein LUO88_03065, partial [Methanoregulaceae archaeon]|nr:hypothetical protein [Methanoregulaceae archaeon]
MEPVIPDMPELSGEVLWPELCEEPVSLGPTVSLEVTLDVPVPDLSGEELVPDLSVELVLDLSTEPELLEELSMLELLLPEVSGL